MPRKVYIDNMPWRDAMDLWWKSLEKAGALQRRVEVVPVTAAGGRVTAVPVLARYSCPHYPAAAMDGIAVRAASTHGAAETNPVRLREGTEYMEIDTGDCVKAPFDAVVMIEEVNFPEPGVAEIIAPAAPYQHVRPVGEDMIQGQMLCPSGTVIGAFEIGSFLAAGVSEVTVVARPRIGIIPTGTELVEPGTRTLDDGEITESNSRMLEALVQEWGGQVHRHPLLSDDREKIKQALLMLLQDNDVVVICSGSSAGREDFTAGIIEEVGEVIVHGLATRPGKPAILGMAAGKAVIGVPGYPVSAAMVFNLFARPLICHLAGKPVPCDHEISARVVKKLASPMGVDEFILTQVARIDEQYRAYPISRGAGITTSLARADGYFVIERGSEGVAAGEEVTLRVKTDRRLLDRTLVCTGSHDLTLDYLGDLLLQRYGIRLLSSNVGSMGALVALGRREAHLGGIHLLDPATGGYNTAYTRKYLGKGYLVVNLVLRQQGIMVAPGNPLGIKSLEDLIRPPVRFVNRQRGAGTRVLLDYELSKQGISPDQINGYSREEFTHLAVAAAIKGGTADAGLGILSAAEALGLDFVPVAEEQYDLAILPDLVGEEWLEALFSTVASREFRVAVERLGGYDLRMSGQIVERA